MTKLATSRDGHPVEVLWTWSEDGVQFAAVKYLDGHQPGDVRGRLAGTEDDPIWEHGLNDREVLTGSDYYNPDHWGTEKGLTFS